jgi:hypothetical protein
MAREAFRSKGARRGIGAVLGAISALAFVLSCSLAAQPRSTTTSPSLLAVPPRTWAVDAVNNEIPVIEHPGQYLRYRMHVIDAKGDQLRDVIESRDGTVARLIERDGRALTEDEDKWEQQRLNEMIAAPEKYKRHVGGDVSGKKRAVELIRMLPDAMVFEYVPGQPQLPEFPGEQVVLDYKPNPAWHPPSTTSEALTGLQGRVWIDVHTRHMVRMEGDIFQAVNLGWGMLAHIYPGGKVMLEQTPVEGSRWIFSRFNEQITVRALMLKTFREDSHVTTETYTTVQSMPYQEAIKTLLASPLPKTPTVALRQSQQP